jgi:hypothetical protein
MWNFYPLKNKLRSAQPLDYYFVLGNCLHVFKNYLNLFWYIKCMKCITSKLSNVYTVYSIKDALYRGLTNTKNNTIQTRKKKKKKIIIYVN